MKHAVVFTGYIDREPVITHASSRVYCYITNDYGYITLPCDIYGTMVSNSNWAITHSQGGARHLCGSSMHLLLEMSGEQSLVPSQCMSRETTPPPHGHAHTPAAYIHCSSATVIFVCVKVFIHSMVAHN